MQDHKLVRRFLLGELNEQQAERVEKRLLEEDELYDLCEAVEAELLEEAARGRLAPAERDRVLKRLASSPQGRARLALAKDLAAIADSTAAAQAPLPFRRRPALMEQPAFRWALAAGLALVIGGIGGGIWNLVQDDEPGDQGQMAAAPPGEVILPRPVPPQPITNPDEGPGGQEEATPPIRPRPDHIGDEIEPEPPVRVQVEPVLVELSLLTLRGGEEEEPKQIEIPSGKEHIEFHVNVTIADFASYDAVVSRGEEEIVRKSIEPTPRNDELFLVLDVPASDLPAGRYEVKVYGKPAEGDPELLMEQELEVSVGG
jgi:hypothetical protein